METYIKLLTEEMHKLDEAGEVENTSRVGNSADVKKERKKDSKLIAGNPLVKKQRAISAIKEAGYPRAAEVLKSLKLKTADNFIRNFHWENVQQNDLVLNLMNNENVAAQITKNDNNFRKFYNAIYSLPNYDQNKSEKLSSEYNGDLASDKFYSSDDATTKEHAREEIKNFGLASATNSKNGEPIPNNQQGNQVNNKMSKTAKKLSKMPLDTESQAAHDLIKELPTDEQKKIVARLQAANFKQIKVESLSFITQKHIVRMLDEGYTEDQITAKLRLCD